MPNYKQLVPCPVREQDARATWRVVQLIHTLSSICQRVYFAVANARVPTDKSASRLSSSGYNGPKHQDQDNACLNRMMLSFSTCETSGMYKVCEVLESCGSMSASRVNSKENCVLV